MPPGQLEQLQKDFTRCQAAHERAAQAAAESAEAGLELGAVARATATIVRHLDALYRIRFVLDPQHLPAWLAARSDGCPESWEPAAAERDTAAVA
jgi:hypothetical protein